MSDPFRFSGPSKTRWSIWRKSALCHAILKRLPLEEAPILASVHDFSEAELASMLRAYQEEGIEGLRATRRKVAA